jgi:hypothetical protein
MGPFDGDPSCRLCGMETETVQQIIWCCEALSRQRYNVFGKPNVEPKDISTVSVKDLCLFIRDTGLLKVCWMECLGSHNKPQAEVLPGHKLTGPKKKNKKNSYEKKWWGKLNGAECGRILMRAHPVQRIQQEQIAVDYGSQVGETSAVTSR